MFLDELCKFTEMTFLVEHLTTKLRLGHDPVKVGRNDPIKRTERQYVSTSGSFSRLEHLRYVVISFTRVEVKVERACKEDLNLHYVMNVSGLSRAGVR